MATLTLTNIRAQNIHPGATAHITGKSHTYVVFSVNNVEAKTSVLDGEAGASAVWNDTVKMDLTEAAGELKVVVYNKRKLIHDHEIGSSHIDLSHLSKSPGAEVRMVLMGKGSQQGELSFLPELRFSGSRGAAMAQHGSPAVPAGGLAAGGLAAGGAAAAGAGHVQHRDTNPAARTAELSPEANHGPGLGGSSVMSRDKAAVSSGAAEPASKGGYASHIAAPGAVSSGTSGTPAGHGDYVNHDKPSGATAGFGGGGAATFDNRGLATGKAHPDNRPPASTTAPGAYPTSGSGVSDPSADLTNPVGAGTAAGAGAGLGAGLGAAEGAHKGTGYSTGTGTGTDTGYSTSTGTGQGGSMLEKAKDTAYGTAQQAKDMAYSTAQTAKDTAYGTAAKVQQGAMDLKDRVTGSGAPGQSGYSQTSTTPASGATEHAGAPLSVSQAEHGGAPLGDTSAHKEYASALEPVAGGAPAEGASPTLLGRAQGLAQVAVGAAVGTAGAAVSTVAGAPRAAYNTAAGVTSSAYNTAAGATQAVYHAVAGGSPSAGTSGSTTTKTEHTTTTTTEGAAKPTLVERAKGLTATAIDTTTHMLDQAKLHVAGPGDAVEAPKGIVGTATTYTAKALDLTHQVLDTAKEKIVGTGSSSTIADKPVSHALPEQ